MNQPGDIKDMYKVNYYDRPLGAYEKLFWLLNQDRPVQFGLVAEIEGSANVDQWRAALDEVQRRHPLLSVCIDDTDVVTRFRYVKNSRIPLRVVPTDKYESWQKEIGIELAIPFDYAQAPLCRAVLMPQGTKSFFFLIAHHSIADGISLTYVLRDLLKALNGEKLKGLPFPPSADDLAGFTQHKQFEPITHPSNSISLDAPQYGSTQKNEISVQALALDPDLSEKIVLRSRNEGTTVNSTFCAALILAGWQATQLKMGKRSHTDLNARIYQANVSCR